MLLQGVLDTTRERERWGGGDAEAERGGSDDGFNGFFMQLQCTVGNVHLSVGDSGCACEHVSE